MTSNTWFLAASVVLIMCMFEISNVQAEVSLTTASSTVTLSNGVVTAIINKSNGAMTSLKKGGGSNLVTSGQIDLNHDGEFSTITNTTYYLQKSTADCIDVGFVQNNFSLLPFVVDVHYVINSNDSGIYYYVVYRRYNQPAGYLEQTRYLLRMNSNMFNYEIASDSQQDTMPTAAQLTAGTPLGPAEAVLLADGRVYSKYDYAVNQDSQRVWGMTGSNIGIWMISASPEYVNGGPTKQELTIHQTTDLGPVAQRMFHGGHFQAGRNTFLQFEELEYWEKMYGPFFIYVNSGTSNSQMWTDAKSQLESEKTKWPYNWLTDNIDYPLNRATVTGNLQLDSGSMLENAWVILGPTDMDWQWAGKKYLFWGQTDENGHFNIANVRPDTYRLSAYCSGIFGQFIYDQTITINSDGSYDLGTLIWTPDSHGVELWRIGTPDRSAAEFKRGNEPIHWGRWLPYTTDFPNDVNFVIGQSNYSNDWNYIHPVVQPSPGTYQLPVWKISFNLNNVPESGQATLTISLAASYNTKEDVFVNGTKVYSFAHSYPYADDAGPRGGNQGCYWNEVINFDVNLLKTGRNVISLAHTQAANLSSIMYDSIRFEAPFRIEGDLNWDGYVNFEDLAIIVQDWLRCTDPGNSRCGRAQ